MSDYILTVTAILVLCTANACRSVMAQAMLSARLTAQGVAVTSAGMLSGGRRPPPEVISVMAARGIDVTGHRSHTVTARNLEGTDLILGLTREHIRHVTVLLPGAWPRAFTLRELVRRGHQAGARSAGEPFGDWLTRAAGDRSRLDLLGSSPADDVADPAGGPPRGYQATAELLDQLTLHLAGLGWPSSARSSRGHRPGTQPSTSSYPSAEGE